MIEIKKQVNAAVRTEEDLAVALESNVDFIFLLYSNILTLKDIVQRVHQAGKKVFVHMDFVEGVGKDKWGLVLLKNNGVDGIITTRTGMIKPAKEAGLITIQRFFIIDSHSVDTAVDSIKISKPDLIEVMPGVIYRKLEELSSQVSVPLMTAGLVETEEDLRAAIDAGAAAVATSKHQLWV